MRVIRVEFIVVFAATVGLIGCPQPAEKTDHAAEAGHAEATSEVHWGYHGDEGPEHWSHLSEEFSLCGAGKEQSPIDLAEAVSVKEAPKLERVYGPGKLQVDDRDHVVDLFDNGHTIQVTLDGDTSVEVDGIHFVLVQFHFHSPSEHTINGHSFPLELHMVHRSTDGRLAVLAGLYEEGDHNPGFDLVVGNLPSGPNDPRHLEGVRLHVDDLLPMPERYYRYDGSLTTPPCSEGVRWVVRAEPIALSAEQIEAFASVLHDNNRPVQQPGGRDIELVTR